MRARLLLVLVAALALSGTAAAAPTRHDAYPLHGGTVTARASGGQRVKNLQWLLAGHRPYVFSEVKPTFKGNPNGLYGARTKAATKAMKFRLGYPPAGKCAAKTNQVTDTAGRSFVLILEGKLQRPACWVAIAASRVRAVVAAEPTRTAVAVRALLVSQLGVHEIPDGSNRGPCISTVCSHNGDLEGPYQRATGAFGAAWCVSTDQWALGVVGWGHFADDTAGVYFAVDYYATRNLVFAKPKFGSLVAFISLNRWGNRIPGTGHMGYVVAVQANSFTYIAGNDGNAVREHTIPDGSRSYVFIRLPGVA